MQKEVSNFIRDRVKQIHYSSPDYKPEPDKVYTYNACPMCGIVTKNQPQDLQEGQSNDIIVTSDSGACSTCNNMKYLHPHVHEWINLLFNQLEFDRQLEAMHKKELSAPRPSVQEEQPVIDVEVINDNEN